MLRGEQREKASASDGRVDATVFGGGTGRLGACARALSWLDGWSRAGTSSPARHPSRGDAVVDPTPVVLG